MLERSKHKMTLGALWQRWRDWTRTQSELQICGDEGMERMAHDAGVSVNEFRELTRHSSDSADLMLERMTALDLDPKEVVRVEPQVFRDMQRVCSVCKTQKRCIADLERDAQNPQWKEYCPNVQTLLSLDALPWAARREG
jgi:hypothetical protein